MADTQPLAQDGEYATWYEADHYDRSIIKPVRVLRETAHQIVLADCHPSNARRAKADTYFRTWEEAHLYMLERSMRELDAARMALSRAQARHGNVKGMRPPVHKPEPNHG